MFNRLECIDLDAKFKASHEYAEYCRYVSLFNDVNNAKTNEERVMLMAGLDSIYRHDQNDFHEESIAINTGMLSKEEAKQLAFALYAKHVCCNEMTVAFQMMLRARKIDSIKDLFDFFVKQKAKQANQSNEVKTKEWHIVKNVCSASDGYLKEAIKAESKFNASIYARVPSHFSEQASLKLQRLKAQKALSGIVNAKKHKERLTKVVEFIHSTDHASFLTYLENTKQTVCELLKKALREAKAFFPETAKIESNKQLVQ